MYQDVRKTGKTGKIGKTGITGFTGFTGSYRFKGLFLRNLQKPVNNDPFMLFSLFYTVFTVFRVLSLFLHGF